MFRQLYIFYANKTIFSHSYALAFDEQQFSKVNEILKEYIEQPVSNQFFNRPYGNFQIFYVSMKGLFYLVIADHVDKKDYIQDIIKKIDKKFHELFPNPNDISEDAEHRGEFLLYLTEAHYDLHSKIALIGPMDVGKTSIAEILKGPEEPKTIMNFAKSYKINIANIYFDLWDFQMNDNFSLLWNNFIRGSDLVILVLDSTKINVKTVSHFKNLHKMEAKFSKIIVLANKQDLSEAEDLKQIENKIETSVLGITLKDPGIKTELQAIISDGLNLKKELPAEFGQILKNAENLALKEEYVNAIMNFKTLITMCKDYQDFSYLGTFEDRIRELDNLRKEKEKQEEIEKRKIKAPEKIKFTGKVAVKALPLPGSVKKSSTQIRQPPQPKETTVSFDALTKKEPPTVQEELPKKKKLMAGDIKINIPPLQAKKQKIKPEPKFSAPVVPEPKSKPNTTTKLLNSPKNQYEILFNFIQQKGGDLSLALCKEYIEKMKRNLDRPLRTEDIEKAAEIFVK